MAAAGLIETAALALLVIFYLLVKIIFDEADFVANVVGPIWLCAALSYGISRSLRGGSETIWTPLVTFRLSTSVFFGFGSLVPLFVNNVSVTYMREFYPFTDDEIARLNLIVALSTLLILGSSGLVQRFISLRTQTSRTKRVNSARTKNITMMHYGLTFFIIGSFIKYLIVIPVKIGWITSDLPGGIASLSSMSLCGIYLLTIWSLSRSAMIFSTVCTVVAAEAFVGLLLLSKTDALLPTIVFFMAMLISKFTYRRVAVILSIAIVFFGVIQPLVSFGRDESLRGSSNATLTERLQQLMKYFDSTTAATDSEQTESALIRMSYVNAATFAMSMYDNGYPGNSFDNIGTVLIPRVLWPDKPVFITGKEFARIVSGPDSENSVSPGLFAEAYWNFGWLGIFGIMVPFGVILTFLSNYNLTMLRRQDWLFLPVVFTNMRMGLSVDGLFVNTVVGTLAIVIGLHCVALIVRALFLERKRYSRSNYKNSLMRYPRWKQSDLLKLGLPPGNVKQTKQTP